MKQKKDKPVLFLTKAQWREFMSVIDKPRDRALFLVAYWNGLRATEVGMIQVSDVDTADGNITIQRLKGSVTNRLGMPPEEIQAVKAWLRARGPKPGPLFPGRNGPIDRRTIYKTMRRYGKMTTIPPNLIHPHAIKHSLATHMLDNGYGIKDVQDRLGHIDIRNTAKYGAISNPRRREVEAGMFAAAAERKKPRTRHTKPPIIVATPPAWVTPIIED